MRSPLVQATIIRILASALAVVFVAASGCRQPSPAVPTEVEIEWPDAAPMVQQQPAEPGTPTPPADSRD